VPRYAELSVTKIVDENENDVRRRT
jgi:hypothetical protein